MGAEEQVNKARAGDDTAFYDLLQENKEMLYRIAFSYVGDKDLALEIFNETVYKAYVHIRKLKQAQFLKTWLTRTLINCCRDTLRKSKKLVPLNDRQAAPAGEERPQNRATPIKSSRIPSSRFLTVTTVPNVLLWMDKV